MKKSNRYKQKIILFSIVAALIFSSKPTIEAVAASSIRLIVDKKDITSLSSPIIENGRTLVPIRFISEELGATVTWNQADRTVKVEKEGKSVFLRIDSHLVEYNNGKAYDLSDVAPKIIQGRTYVPLRLVSNALGIGINWDEVNRYVYVDSSKISESTPFFDVKIVSPNQVVEGKTELKILSSEAYLKEGNEIRYLLLDPNTAKGFVIARGEQITNSYTWLPKLEDKGNKVLVGAIYDKNGKFVAGDSIPVNINVIPKINLVGLQEGQIIDKNVSIGADINFVAHHIKYEITNLNSGKITLTEAQDPKKPFNWNPKFEANGSYSIKVIAYDKNSNSYPSQSINVQVAVEKKLSLGGVSSGAMVNKSVSLSATRNFDVSETEFLIRDVNTGSINAIAKIPYGNHTWFPGPEFSGNKELIVIVKDTRGTIFESNPVNVIVDGSPKILLGGIGPKEVVTKQAKLKVTSNVKLDSVSYTLTNSKTGIKRVLGTNMSPLVECNYDPIKGDEGDVIIQAEGMYNGGKILSERISFRVYLGQTYGSKPVIEKDKFVGLASGLAKVAREKTGMSAALQTAQSILETGFGQSVPVDKYTGLLSNNLFGIKGKGPAGSVISNTWEVYNGVTYRIDAEFRAYNSVDTSWADHKEFLKRDRYSDFRDVMHDSTLGAWALSTAGYATDPQYAIKLMKLIDTYNLLELDKVGI